MLVMDAKHREKIPLTLPGRPSGARGVDDDTTMEGV